MADMSAAEKALAQAEYRLNEEIEDRQRSRDSLHNQVLKVRKSLEEAELGLKRHQDKTAELVRDLNNVRLAQQDLVRAERSRKEAQDHLDSTLGVGI